MPNDHDPCPCGSGKPFGDCCGALLAGRRAAATAEELMRARFTAHAIHDFGFVHRTYVGTAKLPFEQPTQVPSVQWTRLEIHRHTPDVAPHVAHVEFSAHGVENGVGFVHQEKAEFREENGAWIYTRPLREGPAPVKAPPKVGRNDPCPCGSGKKYKHCHGR